MMAAETPGSGFAPDRFETQRLSARRITARDRPYLLQLYTDRDVARTLGGVREVSWIAQRHLEALEHWQMHGFGEYVLFDRVTGDFVGRVLLRRMVLAGRDENEIGYAFLPQYWNRGFGTEAAQAVMQIGLNNLGLADLVAFTQTTNHASQRVMEKIGMRFSHEAEHAGYPHVFYRITL